MCGSRGVCTVCTSGEVAMAGGKVAEVGQSAGCTGGRQRSLLLAPGRSGLVWGGMKAPRRTRDLGQVESPSVPAERAGGCFGLRG